MKRSQTLALLVLVAAAAASVATSTSDSGGGMSNSSWSLATEAPLKPPAFDLTEQRASQHVTVSLKGNAVVADNLQWELSVMSIAEAVGTAGPVKVRMTV